MSNFAYEIHQLETNASNQDRKIRQLEAKVKELEGKIDSLTDDFVTSEGDLARALDWINEVEPLVKQFPALVNILCTLSNGVGAEIEAAINNEDDLAAYWPEPIDDDYVVGQQGEQAL